MANSFGGILECVLRRFYTLYQQKKVVKYLCCDLIDERYMSILITRKNIQHQEHKFPVELFQ